MNAPSQQDIELLNNRLTERALANVAASARDLDKLRAAEKDAERLADRIGCGCGQDGPCKVCLEALAAHEQRIK